MEIKEILEGLDIGLGVAEQEANSLDSFFVQTNQWRRIMRGDIDVIYGPKGAGKSALYALLLRTSPANASTAIIAADNPRGTPSFKKVEVDPPTSEREFQNLWKLYFAALIGNFINDLPTDKSSSSLELIDLLESENLIDDDRDTVLTRVIAWLAKRRPALEGGVSVDPISGELSASGRISIDEAPPGTARSPVSIEKLIQKADAALKEIGRVAWVAIDRLDVAFIDNPTLEENALRALFHAYLDLLRYDNIKLKIFLRTDIWRRLTTGRGFPEASHIVRQSTIDWSEEQLLNLIMRRLLNNEAVVQHYRLDRTVILSDMNMQRNTFSRIFPKQVVSGERRPDSLTWMLTRTADGTKRTAPRELIQLLNHARDAQLQDFEIGASDIVNEGLFGGSAIKRALEGVSRQRLDQTIYPEYPTLKPYIEKMEGQKSQQTLESLSTLWKTAGDETQSIASRLVDVGFFEKRGLGESTTFWVPFLYRPGLKIVQGSAEFDE